MTPIIFPFKFHMSVIRHPRLGDFEVLCELGEGMAARVYKARHTKLDLIVAIKEYNYGVNLSPEAVAAMRCNHPLIVEIYDFFEYNGKAYMLMEYVEGKSLIEHVIEKDILTEEEARNIFVQLLIAVDHLHRKVNLLHRDLKCDNIMIDKNMNIRLIDFGFSRSIDNLMMTPCGSTQYAAPEILQRQPYTKAVDIWSMGIILYAIVFGFLPFDSDNMNAMVNLILHLDPIIPKSASPELASLVLRMIQKDPKQRITLEEIFNHPWVKYDTKKRQLKPKEVLFNMFESESFNIDIDFQKSIDNPLSKDGVFTRIARRKSQTNLMKELTNSLYGNTPLPILTIGGSYNTSRSNSMSECKKNIKIITKQKTIGGIFAYRSMRRKVLV